MTVNDDVKEYLEYYLCSDVESDFAVMLNGPWGAGKTHFIKTYLKERQKSSADGPSHLYASLYGIRSTAEITEQFFAQVHPILNSKAVRIVGTVLSRALNGFAGTDVNSGQENKAAVQELVLKLEGRVLVFDDLERCAMPLIDVMGFINAYVEHEGLKVIVIANETDIPEEQKKEYFRRKEKLVGKTLQVCSDPESVLNSFVDKLKNKAVIETVKRESLPLLRTFTASEKRNFRSLRSVLSDFERLVTIASPRLQEAPQAMSNLLLYMAAVGLEYRSGELTAAELAALPLTMQAKTIARLIEEKKSSAILKAEQLEAMYPDVVWNDPIVSPMELATLFESGLVDTASINEQLTKHPLVVGYSEAPAWRRLWRWSDLPYEQYTRAREDLLTGLQAHALTHPGIILHVAGIIIRLQEHGDYLLDGEDVVAFFKRYAAEVRIAGKLEPARELFSDFHGFNDSFEGLGYAAIETPQFREIYEVVHAETEASFDESMRKVAETYLNRISGKPDAYSSLHEWGVEDGNYGGASFLHHIDPAAFAEVIIKDYSVDGRLLANLSKRFDSEMHHHRLVVEYPWLTELRTHLDRISAAAPPPYKRMLVSRIAYYFDDIEKAIHAAQASALTVNDIGEEAGA